MPKRKPAMTPEEFNAALARLGLTPYAAATVIGVSLRQSHRYANGEQAVPKVVANLLAAYLSHGMPAPPAAPAAPAHI